MRHLLLSMACLACLGGTSSAAKGPVSVAPILARGKVEGHRPDRISAVTYQPRTGGPTYQLRVPANLDVRDASLSKLTPTRTTRAGNQIFTLSRGLFAIERMAPMKGYPQFKTAATTQILQIK